MVGAQARRSQGAALSEPVFRREGDAFVPTGHARGPWDPGQLHGGAPGALIAEAVQEEGYLVARLTLDFLGPVPMAPLTVSARTTKPGRSLQLAEAELSVDGQAVVRARAVRLRRGRSSCRRASRTTPPRRGRRRGATTRSRRRRAMSRAFTSRRWTSASSTAATSARVPRGHGSASPCRWSTTLPASPLARAVAAADFGNGISRIVDFDRYLFVNTDLTVHLHREPAGEWVLLDARTVLEPHGAGLARSLLSDERGRVGLGAQSLFVAERA